MVAGGAEGEEFGEAGCADGVCEVEVCGAGEGDFPVEVGEGVGGDEGVDYYFAGGDGGGGVLHKGEAFEVFEVEEEVGDGGDVGDV